MSTCVITWKKAVLRPSMVEFREPNPDRTLTENELRMLSFCGDPLATTALVLEKRVQGENVLIDSEDVFVACGHDYILRDKNGVLSVMSKKAFDEKYCEMINSS